MSEKISFEMVLKTATSLPMVKIDRDKFLSSALKPYFDKETIQTAIEHNPAYAGITVSQIEKIAKESINYETTKVTALSVAAGLPGGIAMIGTVPADLTQYFGHMMRILQKLIYLYGWQDLYDENDTMSDEMQNLLTLFAGIMFGVNGAAAAIQKIAEKAAENVARQLAQKALMKGAIYPIVKKVASYLGVHMTKTVFARGVSKVIPVIGGIASGGLTFATYKPMAIKLKKHLEQFETANVEFYKNMKENSYTVVEENEDTETE